MVKDIELRQPSLPISYWNKYKNVTQNWGYTNKCGKYPSIFHLEFNNVYWQTLRTSNGTFQLFGAYYDIRNATKRGPVVRLVGVIDRTDPAMKTFCQLWFDGELEPVVAPTFEYKLIWYKEWGTAPAGIYQPYLTSCEVPENYHDKIPGSVSLVEGECDLSKNNLRVIYNQPEEKEDFAVCVKGLDFLNEDVSVRLVEWIELNHILGAAKIFIYILDVHPNVSKVLDYYERQGIVQTVPITLPGQQPNIPGFQHLYILARWDRQVQNELITYNDCLYKNIYKYKYIALVDTDEVLMPRGDLRNWTQLMDVVLMKAEADLPGGRHKSYSFRNNYVFDEQPKDCPARDDVPSFMHMLTHLHKSENYTQPGHYVKCFHDTETVHTLHNHYPMSCLDGWCSSFEVPVEDGHLMHYRADCAAELRGVCQEFRDNHVEELAILKWKDELIERSLHTLDQLGFLHRKSESDS